MDRQRQSKALFRSKLKEFSQNRDKRTDSPLVRYNESDQPVCRVCNVALKSETLWPAHQASRKHHEAIENLKATAARVTQATRVNAEKLVELQKSRPASTLPADCLDKEETKMQKDATAAKADKEVNFAKADKEILVDIVKFTQKHGLIGSKGAWKDFLDSYDKRFGSSVSNPAKRSTDVLVAFLQSFPKTDLKYFGQMIRRYSDRTAIERFFKKKPNKETPEQKLVRLTVEHPQYTQRYSFTHDEDFVTVPLGKVFKAMNSKALISVDCEMVLCEDGTEALVRVCAVDQNLEVKLDKVVNPNKTVADYRTDITGITAKDLEGITCSLDEVQKLLKKLLSYGTILIGHSLHNDLKVLKIYHPRVIDTSCIFRFKDLPTIYSPSLNNLCKSVLGYKIRREGEHHNCLSDAEAAMKLVLAKLEHGFDDPIAIAVKDVPDSELSKLLLHKIPVEIPYEDLRSVFSMEYDIDIQADLRVRGQTYSTYAVFKDVGDADAAFRSTEGPETIDSGGRLQKRASLTIGTGQTFHFYVRKMRPNGQKTENDSSKKRFILENGNQDSKRQKMCLNNCDHVKEIDRLKQQLCDKEDEIFRLQKVLASLVEDARFVN